MTANEGTRREKRGRGLSVPMAMRLSDWAVRFLLSAVLAGAELMGGHAPFALALVGVCRPGAEGFAALLGAALGYLSFRGLIAGLRYIAAAMMVYAVTLALGEPGREVAGEEETGELLILGPTVGPGYFGRADLTEKVFFTHPETGLRGYRTGDLCYRKNGLYYYCGRVDNQLKLNGYRIEIEDVEANLQKLPNVQRAAVVPVRDADQKVQYLAAFLLLREADGLTSLKRSIQLKKQAAAYLPAYMIPRKLLVVESFPLNVNGKIDKKALAASLEEGAP